MEPVKAPKAAKESDELKIARIKARLSALMAEEGFGLTAPIKFETGPDGWFRPRAPSIEVVLNKKG